MTNAYTSKSLFSLRAVLCAVVGVVLSVVVPLGQAEASFRECVDIEALMGLTLTEAGRQQAAELVRQGHPAREYICLELGWDCDNDPGFQHLTLDDQEEGELEDGSIEFDDPSCAGSVLPDESRCSEPDAQGAWQSYIGDLLAADDDAPRMPLGNLAMACFDDPTTCNALPPIERANLFTPNPVPTLDDDERKRADHTAAAELETRRHASDGLGAADGILRTLKRPPRV